LIDPSEDDIGEEEILYKPPNKVEADGDAKDDTVLSDTEEAEEAEMPKPLPAKKAKMSLYQMLNPGDD
jgi:hypothetical protein